MLDEGIEYRSFPAVKIGLLAADERAKGAGTRLVDWALAYIAGDLWPKLGIRFVTVDALLDPDSGYDSSGYYRKFGFLLTNPHDPTPMDGFNTMFLDILPFRRSNSGRTRTPGRITAESAAAMIHIGHFGAKFAERLMSMVTPVGISVYGEPDENVRGALAGFSPVFLGTFDGFRR